MVKCSIHVLTIGSLVVLIVTGVSFLVGYSLNPYPTEIKSSGLWPNDSSIKITKGSSNLLVFIHPKCSCSVATLVELERLLPELKKKALVKIVFIKPSGRNVAWVEDDLWLRAKSFQDVELFVDNEGKEAKKFQASSSGQTMLFDDKKNLIFNGGLTSMRGHIGPSIGQNIILSWIHNIKITTANAYMYGCGLFGRARGE